VSEGSPSDSDLSRWQWISMKERDRVTLGDCYEAHAALRPLLAEIRRLNTQGSK